MRDNTGSHGVIEMKLSAREAIAKVDIHRPLAQVIDYTRQGQIVCGDKAHRAGIQERPEDALGPGDSIGGVGAGKDFIHQEEERGRISGRDIEQLADLGNLGEETRSSGLERILHPHGGPHRERAQPELSGAHDSARQREYRVHAHSAQERTLARHIRTTDDQRSWTVSAKLHIVANRFLGW